MPLEGRLSGSASVTSVRAAQGIGADSSGIGLSGVVDRPGIGSRIGDWRKTKKPRPF